MVHHFNYYHGFLNTDFLKSLKAQTCWVPSQPIDKQNCLKIFGKLLKHYRDEGDSFLKQVITVDESCFHHFELETEQQNTVFK